MGFILGKQGEPSIADHWKINARDGKRIDAIAQAAGKKSRARFLKNLPALGKLTEAVKTKAKDQGFVKGLDGRLIYTRSAHSSLNTLLQGAGAILMKKALVICDRDIQAAGFVPGVHYEFVANVHDEFQIEALEEHADAIGEIAKQSITAAGEAYRFACPLSGSFSVGRTWADTH